MASTTVERVRSFNRTVMTSIGALDDRFLGRGRSIGEARFLWEVGESGAAVRELRQRLGLDSGYTSRLLRSLEKQGMIEVAPDRADARVRRVSLTPAGLAERQELDRRSDALAESLLDPLPPDEREQLAGAMAQVERILLRSQVTIAREPAGSPAVRWCFGQYFAELDRRFDSGFDVARSNRADVADLRPPAGLVLVARLRTDPVGCGALRFHPDAIAELKRMWVSPRVRGIGLGRRLLEDLERLAAEHGASTLHLETNRNLQEAVAMYRRAGYREVPAFNDEPYAHHWFEKVLPGQ